MKTIHSFMGMALCSFPVMAQQSPNFLIIQCDHLTQRVVGAYGADPSCTPPIDRIASQGVTFANAYVGCPLSQPSRAALWSGLMPHQTNVRSNSAEHINPPLPDSIPTLGSLFTANGYEAVHFGKTHDMGSLRGFRHKEPVAKPFTDPEFPVNNDSFLDVGTCEDAVAYLSNPPQEPFICIADFQNPHNICGYVGENKGEHIDSPISTPLPLLPENFEVEDWEKLPLPIQYICCSHRRMMQAAHWNEDNYRHYVAAFQHYTRIVARQIESVLESPLLHSRRQKYNCHCTGRPRRRNGVTPHGNQAGQLLRRNDKCALHHSRSRYSSPSKTGGRFTDPTHYRPAAHSL